jgi:hypothetical protein
MVEMYFRNRCFDGDVTQVIVPSISHIAVMSAAKLRAILNFNT